MKKINLLLAAALVSFSASAVVATDYDAGDFKSSHQMQSSMTDASASLNMDDFVMIDGSPVSGAVHKGLDVVESALNNPIVKLVVGTFISKNVESQILEHNPFADKSQGLLSYLNPFAVDYSDLDKQFQKFAKEQSVKQSASILNQVSIALRFMHTAYNSVEAFYYNPTIETAKEIATDVLADTLYTSSISLAKHAAHGAIDYAFKNGGLAATSGWAVDMVLPGVGRWVVRPTVGLACWAFGDYMAQRSHQIVEAGIDYSAPYLQSTVKYVAPKIVDAAVAVTKGTYSIFSNTIGGAYNWLTGK